MGIGFQKRKKICSAPKKIRVNTCVNTRVKNENEKNKTVFCVAIFRPVGRIQGFAAHHDYCGVQKKKLRHTESFFSMTDAANEFFVCAQQTGNMVGIDLFPVLDDNHARVCGKRLKNRECKTAITCTYNMIYMITSHCSLFVCHTTHCRGMS